jgi:hypothetical protein
MIVLIPLGGLGLRFKNLGYKLPKPLINVMVKSIIFWLLDNLNLNNIDFVIIPYNNELAKYRFESLLIKTYPNICLERINKRNRTGEDKIELDYLNLCSKYHEDMMCELRKNNIEVIILDGNVDIYIIPNIYQQWYTLSCPVHIY